MTTTAEFQTKLAEIKLAMEREEWGKAIHELENIGNIPEKFYAITSNILFFLYISRNQYQKLDRLSDKFDFSKSKDSVSSLLLFRDKELEYPISLPQKWTISALEEAIESHATAGKLEPTELQLCLYFLSFLDRPRLLGSLFTRSVESGGKLDSESIEVVLRCYLKHKMFEEARRLVWFNNLNAIPFDRFNFLIDQAENPSTPIPESNDKFLTFLRYKFGSQVPKKSSEPNPTT